MYCWLVPEVLWILVDLPQAFSVFTGLAYVQDFLPVVTDFTVPRFRFTTLAQLTSLKANLSLSEV